MSDLSQLLSHGPTLTYEVPLAGCVPVQKKPEGEGEKIFPLELWHHSLRQMLGLGQQPTSVITVSNNIQ